MQVRALVSAAVGGTILQLVMVVWGHGDSAVAALFAVGGMGISLLAGLAYGWMARGGLGSKTLGGAAAGGICGLAGIAVSLALGDVEPVLLVLGTASSAVAGAAGGALGVLLAPRRAKG